MATYTDKLKDPKWQKLRLKVFKRDKWRCRFCGDDQSPLHIHHTQYEDGKEPWEHDPYTLITLCEKCHSDEYNNRRDSEKEFLRILKVHGFSIADINILTGVFDNAIGGRKFSDPTLFSQTLDFFVTEFDDEVDKLIRDKVNKSIEEYRRITK